MSRRWFLHLAVLASSAGLALVVAELVVRAFDLAPTAGITIADAPTFARIPGVFTPSRRWRDVGFTVRYDANNAVNGKAFVTVSGGTLTFILIPFFGRTVTSCTGEIS